MSKANSNVWAGFQAWVLGWSLCLYPRVHAEWTCLCNVGSEAANDLGLVGQIL